MRRQKLGLALSLLSLLINLVEIVPWYLPQSPAITSEIGGQHLRVLQSNINKYNNQYSQLIALVREEKPDIAIFLEVGKTTKKAFEVLDDILPYSLAGQDTDIIDGTIVYSKLPLENKSVKSIGGRVSVLADLTVQGQVISLITGHPSHPMSKVYFEERNQQLAKIADYVAKVKNPLLIGDFNVTMWSPYYRRFVSKAGISNARAGFGILPTWPTFRPLLYIPIDHCFVRRNIKVLNIRTGRDVGSDHLPLITDLLIK
jgi:endonuclease/exonuclease/phosphatase (EEP) superfamily protein YafD